MAEQIKCEKAFTQDFGAWVLLVLAIVVVYAPVVSCHYGFGDDFSVYFDDSNVTQTFLTAGRPGSALAHLLVHRYVETTRQLSVLRAIAIAGTVLVASIFFVLARRWWNNPIICLCFSLAIVTLPSVQELVAMAHCWTFSTAAAAGSASAMLLQWAFFSSRSQKTKWIALLSSLLLMQAALATYQPCAMWYWSVTLFLVIDRRFLSSPDYRRSTLKVVFAGVVFLAVGFIVMKAVLYYLQLPAQKRSEFTTEPLTKMYWFLRMQLTLGLILWQIFSGNRMLVLTTAAFTALIITFGYIADSWRWVSRRERNAAAIVGLRTALVIVVILASHSHWLVVDVMPQNYRIAGALCVSVLILAAWSVDGLFNMLFGLRKGQRQVVAVFVTVALLATLKCQFNLEHYIIDPHRTAYRYVLFSLRSQLTANSTRVHMVRQTREEGLVAEELTQPFAQPFSLPSWSAIGIAKVALREAGVPHRIQEITVGAKGDPIPNSTETVVIEMGKIAQFRLAE